MSAPATNNTAHESPVTGAPACPKCAGRMWDNRATKRNPKAPDYKCRDRSCDGVLWPGQHKAAEPIFTPRAALNAAAHGADAATPATTSAGQGSGTTDVTPAPARFARATST